MDSFVYRWRQTSTGKWYIGYHLGEPNDGYICSSKIVKPMIQANPLDWERKILKHGTRLEMVALEHRLLKKLLASTNPKSYNMSNGGTAGNFMGYRHVNSDVSQGELNRLTVIELINKFKTVLQEGNAERIFKMDKFILSKVMQNV